MNRRLDEIAELIRATCLVDVGSDHGLLIVKLLNAGRIDRGIAIENKRVPFENSIRAMEGKRGEVRFGDGLKPLEVGEADFLSICGIGAKNIIRILDSNPERIPQQIVLQPSNHPESIRKWAWQNQYHLINETFAVTRHPHTILSFQKSTIPDKFDPAYDSIDLESGLMFGPLTIKQRDPEFVSCMKAEADYWSRFARLELPQIKRLRLIRGLLDQTNVTRTT